MDELIASRFVRYGEDSLEHLKIADANLAAVLRGEEYLIQDGAMGTVMQSRGYIQAGEIPDLLVLNQPEKVISIHQGYVEAGAQIITTNTFSSNREKLDGTASVGEVYRAAVQCAREAGARYVGANVGPIGSLLEPLGTVSFDEAYDIFAEQMVAAQAAGADVISLETMTDLLETKAAILAAKENCDLPIFALMTFGEDGRTFLGTSPEVATLTLSALGVQALGVNCSLGPRELAPIVKSICKYATCPVAVRPNAGLPQVENGQTVYKISPEEYGQAMIPLIDSGASILGGCCGTTSEFIEEIARLVTGKKPIKPRAEQVCAVTSSQEAVILGKGEATTVVIGERINPTGKPRFRDALRDGNLDYALEEAVAQQRAGAQILDVNVGLPEIDEPSVLVEIMKKLQVVTTLPLQIDSSDPLAIEAAVRRYAGKPIINSVNGKQESLDAILPIVKHYGCTVVALTLDDEGIPPTAEERFAIAEKIVREAEVYGIPRQAIVVDCLVMAAATNQKEVQEILKAITLVKERLGVRTALGVSNVSFGLPRRDLVNTTFLAAALGVGLDMPILNPLSERYMDAVNSFRVLSAEDGQAARFIAEYAETTDPYRAGNSAPAEQKKMNNSGNEQPDMQQGNREPGHLNATEASQTQSSSVEGGLDDLIVRDLIMTGRKAQMEEETIRLLASREPLDIVNEVFIPTLDLIGAKYERGEFFLPQMMASAEVVKVGFDTIRSHAAADSVDKGQHICLATVKGDIHDIGKNIVKMLLENYGYHVIDLGRDVSPEAILDAVREYEVTLVGLSALMTTTVKAMEETIRLLHEEVPECVVFVGGAVLNPEYAASIGADFYGKDAPEAVRIAEKHFMLAE